MPRGYYPRGFLPMMKKLALFLLSLFLFAAPSLWAQGKANVQILGKNKGNVSSLQIGGETLLDARAVTKKLGGSVELFSTSRQLKVAFPGMYAILTASQREIILNAAPRKLSSAVAASGGKIYVPVQFFMLPEVQKALDRQIVFENNTLIVEKNYTLAWEEKVQESSFDCLRLKYKGALRFTSKQINKHTAEAVFSDVVLKRPINLSLKDGFIRSVALSQRGKDAVLKVILGKNGKVWAVQEGEGELVFTVSAKALPTAVLKPAPIADTVTETEEPEELDLGGDDLDKPSLAAEPSQEPQKPVMRPVPGPIISPTGPQLHGPRKMRIVIDPGHGGKDPGATRRGSAQEKDLNLNVAKHLYTYLQKQGFDVKLTRDKDAFVALAGRSKMANEYKADLFISVHTNAAKRTAANGFEVYFRSDKATDKEAAEVAAFENEALQYEETHYNFVDMLLQSLAKTEYMNESSKLAGHVRNYVFKEPGIGIAVAKASSIRQANFYVLKGVQSPAILIEMGYISSAKDKARLNNKTVQKRMAEGIGKGVVSYAKAEGWLK